MLKWTYTKVGVLSWHVCIVLFLNKPIGMVVLVTDEELIH